MHFKEQSWWFCHHVPLMEMVPGKNNMMTVCYPVGIMEVEVFLEQSLYVSIQGRRISGVNEGFGIWTCMLCSCTCGLAQKQLEPG